MPSIDHKNIREILNLRASSLISNAVAERQLEVIRRGFNHLNQEDNNVLYIADEVGLGKTYIAIGIASLLRHFSDSPGSYQDMILVPKKNLQHKWQKEIRQFINNNYLLQDNRVRSVIGAPVGEIQFKEQLAPIHTDHPAYHLYRNSQFSLAFNWRNENKRAQLDVMEARLTNDEAKEIFRAAKTRGYFNGNKSILKKLYAYLLSACHPEIELLIVDEGHNFKHGLGDEEYNDVSDRNNVVTRFLGIRQRTKEDKELFGAFPDLNRLVKPKVKKLVVLSATPKTESLLEIRNQLDCFLPKHLLSGARTEKDVEEQLHHFLIRGNMEYSIDAKPRTRNQCREEHRQGNVERNAPALPLVISDHEQAIVLGLLQYNTIKHLQAKNNPSFELGMLAGFETFQVDQVKRAIERAGSSGSPTEAPEYEEYRSRTTRTSQDFEVLKKIIDSYKTNFGCLPPHPKQDAIVDAVFRMMLTGQKSLIFVRRVASANELERRLLDKWEGLICQELSGKWMRRLASTELRQMLSRYQDYRDHKDLVENLDSIFKGVVNRLTDGRVSYPFTFSYHGMTNEEVLRIGLDYLYLHHGDNSDLEDWYQLLLKHARLSNIKTELVKSSYDLMLRYQKKWEKDIDGGRADEDEEELDQYYFHGYFGERANQAFRKNRIHGTDWFDLNYFLLNQRFRIAGFRENLMEKGKVSKQIRAGSEMKEVQEYFLKHIDECEFNGATDESRRLHPQLLKPTLITELLSRFCERELQGFFNQLIGKSKSAIFAELSKLGTILVSVLRNGAGFLPLYIADKSEKDTIEAYLSMISDADSVFHLVLQEVQTIISDYALIRAVNFPEGESVIDIQNKLKSQTPVIGLTGQSRRDRSRVAAQFRMPGFPYVMITTDIFREGEDLHTYCQNIYHYGIAWNCSDMEQRTGRIDRINSMSHRKMERNGQVGFEEKVHVFYPYIQQTLEVNQVTKLFHSINRFMEKFNDFTQPMEDDGRAELNTQVFAIPAPITSTLRSKYEHHFFKGYECKLLVSPKGIVGSSERDLIVFLGNVEASLQKEMSFHYGPVLDRSRFQIIGDAVLRQRNARRGPFVIRIRNSEYPGRFKLEAASHIFKASNKVRKAVEQHSKFHEEFEFNTLGEYFALYYEIRLEDYQEAEFMSRFLRLLNAADEIESKLAKGEDSVVFG